MSSEQLIRWAWCAMFAVWLIGALTTKRAVRRYSRFSRIVETVVLIVAYVLIFDPNLNAGFLDARVVPATPPARILGVALTFAGLLFAIWARFRLGRNWSGAITIKQDHELIRTGPYRMVRHPIYSGLLLGLLGTAIAFGQVRDFIAVLLAAVAWRLKSLVEEQYMTEQFGDEYTNYKRDVKALVPFIW
jgi:protein-S-isoprenylcysteine O-methyltransferase Ste14